MNGETRAEFKKQKANRRYERDLAAWKDQAQKISAKQTARYRSALEEHRKVCAQAKQRHEAEIRAWEAGRQAWLRRQQQTNLRIERRHAAYMRGHPTIVADYCDLVLSRSEFPDLFPKSFDLSYEEKNRQLLVDYRLPSPEELPKLKRVTYVKKNDEFREQDLSDRERRALYESVVFQIVLRTIHELFEADLANALDAAVFNAIVEARNSATGVEDRICVASVRALREEFLKIDLKHVDPVDCVRKALMLNLS